MFINIEEVQRFIKKNKIKMVDLKFSDMFGKLYHITVPSPRFSSKVVKEGIGYDGSSIPGFKEIESGDMCIIPDLSTGSMDPFWDIPTLSFICNSVEADTKKEYHKDPRTVAQKAQGYLKETGIADEAYFGPEFEFYIFDSLSIENEPSSTSFRIICEESIAGRERREMPSPGHKMVHKQGYHQSPPLDTLYNLRARMAEEIEKVGIKVHYHHHEVGAPGQSEIEISLRPLCEIADATMMIKYIIRNIAEKEGKTATFMPKPLFTEAGNGMHVHQYLSKKGKNLFFDGKGAYAGLSKTALHYIGGILKHGRALTAFTNPSTNSFKRLVPGYEAPVNLFFSLANRSAAIRIPKYAAKEEDKRIEYRPPDFTSNIYYCLAALLMAGIDGIKNKIDPGKENFGPFDIDIFNAPEEVKKKIMPLPESLEEALQALDKDYKFLLEGGVFTEDIIESWKQIKLENEIKALKIRPHPYEFQLYYGV
jgi:glutamine synthetase